MAMRAARITRFFSQLSAFTGLQNLKHVDHLAKWHSDNSYEGSLKFLKDMMPLLGVDSSCEVLAAGYDSEAAAACLQEHSACLASKVATPGEVKKLRPSTHDSILISGLFEYSASPKEVLSDLFRVLKPGGKLVFSLLTTRMNQFTSLGTYQNIRRKISGAQESSDPLNLEQIVKSALEVGYKPIVYSHEWIVLQDYGCAELKRMLETHPILKSEAAAAGKVHELDQLIESELEVVRTGGDVLICEATLISGLKPLI